MTLIPCGHTYCRQCLANANGLCAECGSSSPATTTIYNAQLDAICSKYELKRSALASIQRAIMGPGPGPGPGPGAGGAGTASGGGRGVVRAASGLAGAAGMPAGALAGRAGGGSVDAA